MYVPHIYDFGKGKYVHMIIDTFSGLLVATALTKKTLTVLVIASFVFLCWVFQFRLKH